MPSKPKGDFETVYLGWDGASGQRVPCGGLDYTAPYNSLAQNSLAPGSVNTQTINGVLCSSPAIANSPWNQSAIDGQLLGIFPLTFQDEITGVVGCVSIVVTTLSVYFSQSGSIVGPGITQVPQDTLTLLYNWGYPGDINTSFLFPGQPVSFVQVENTLYFTGMMLNGIYSVTYNSGGFYSFTFSQTTDYVSASYLFLLDGYMCAAQCRFPGGGGTGTGILPTIAWSVPGGFTTWDPTVNPEAGYNELPDVSDRITGVDTTGRSAFIMRLHGITQQDPNLGSGAGLQPWVWYHLWASPQGIGAYDATVAQFGEVALFLSSDNVYMISLSAGVQPMGQKIIPKINQDALNWGGYLTPTAIELVSSNPAAFLPYYYFGSIVEISGELHYLLVMSNAKNSSFPPGLPTSNPHTGYVYDLNMADNSWHFWDMDQYYASTGTNNLFYGFTTPIVQIRQYEQILVSNGSPNNFYSYSPNFYLFGGEIGNPLTQPVLQFIPFAYNQTTWPTVYQNLLALLYPLVCLPQSTIVFRGETVTAGSKVTFRRLKMQTDSVAISAAQTSQLATVSLVGSNQSSNCPKVNIAPKSTGAPIQTFYADTVLSDEFIQASITSPPLAPALGGHSPNWATMATFRLVQVSFVGTETTGSKV